MSFQLACFLIKDQMKVPPLEFSLIESCPTIQLKISEDFQTHSSGKECTLLDSLSSL